MLRLISKYTRWLHTAWPAGTVEKAPKVNDDGTTRVPGLRVVGDLTGVPLLKFSADSGARSVESILQEADFEKGKAGFDFDLVIVGGGVSGLSAAIEAKKAGLNFVVYETSAVLSTIRNFPRGKPIFTYPSDMTPAGELRFNSSVKEDLIDELEEQRSSHGIESVEANVERVSREGGGLVIHLASGDHKKAQRVIIAIGKSGNYRKLGVPGEEMDKVMNRLIDPREFAGRKVLVAGGGDSALEAAVSIAENGASVDLIHRRDAFSRPKPDNIEAVEKLAEEGKLKLRMSTSVKEIVENKVRIAKKGEEDVELENDFVLTFLGREAPLEFFRKSNISITGEFTGKTWSTLVGFFIAFTLFYHWQKGLWFSNISPGHLSWMVSSVGGLFQSAVDSPKNLLHHIRIGMNQPGFYYSLAYCVCVVIFGLRRIKRRKTPYVKLQTITLAVIQIGPLFLLPWILLPWTGALGWWDSGFGAMIGDALWPDGSYWRAFGLILAWPLFVYNWFTAEPLWGWLILGFLQTFVIIPFIVWRWGKGAYCGWICSCGALAETLGDDHRHKMPHGPIWNRVNMIGQVLLGIAAIMMIFRIVGWVLPNGNWAENALNAMLSGIPVLNWKYAVDVWLAGVFGVAFYFHFSGRIWCRFACPLAALMHIYARFTRFRIFSDKKKCISCNVCTSVCHQGIDIMNFANKGLPMEDPECVRCSACVQSCPTGVLNFGRYDTKGVIKFDSVPASIVQMAENARKADNAKAQVR
ncbi:NAD(P)-binding domain-containing protein [Puniceicoccaceae bacterium K14]|nr:NAD(P)-binding domain-containing protein [Puniceicoccaceae bacterium K14]